MEFDIDDNGNVRVDGVPTKGFDVVEDITSEPGVTVTEEAIVLTEAEPAKGLHASAFRPTTVTYAGTTSILFEEATAEEMDVANLEGYARQDIQRRVIFAHMPVAGYLVVERIPAAIESSFTKGVFVTLPAFD